MLVVNILSRFSFKKWVLLLSNLFLKWLKYERRQHGIHPGLAAQAEERNTCYCISGMKLNKSYLSCAFAQVRARPWVSENHAKA